MPPLAPRTSTVLLSIVALLPSLSMGWILESGGSFENCRR